MTTLQGKRIFISGAAAGMGYSVARFSGGWCEVHATDLSLNGLKTLLRTVLIQPFWMLQTRRMLWLLCRSA